MRNILPLLSLLLFATTGIYGNNAGPTAGTTIDSASELFNEISEKYTSDMPDPEMHECAASYLRLCDMYYRCGYYSNAFIAASTALRIAEERRFNDLLAPIYNNLGKIYCTWHDFSLGTKYFIKGLSFASPGNDPDTYRALIINIQGVYLNMNRPGEAKPYYRKLQEDVPRNPTVEYFLTLNRGLFLLADGDSAVARERFNDAAAIASANDFDPSLLCSTYEYIGDTFNGRDSSLFYWRKAVELPGIPAYLRLGLLKKLHDTLRRRGDLGAATRYGDMYMSLSDSLFETGEINRVKDFQLSYENEKRMRRINELDADKRERDIRLANQRRLIMLTFGALLVFLTMTVILYIQRHRLRQAYLDLFRRNKEAIDTQLGFELREKELRKEIAELRHQIETSEASVNDAADKAKAAASADNIVNDAADNSSHEHRSQSVHNLTEAKRESILTAIEKALADESLICRTDFSIDMLAEITGHNTRYVSHILNGRYGCNFRTLLNNLRMDIARRRIIDIGNYGHLTIQAIAESLGYKSNSGFVQLFRKYTGVTPSMFQKMAREEQSQQTTQPDTATTTNFSEKHQ